MGTGPESVSFRLPVRQGHTHAGMGFGFSRVYPSRRVPVPYIGTHDMEVPMEQPDKVREPAWLTALADQRLSLLRDHVAQEAVAQVGLVMTPLTEPAEDASPEERERWERTCDNCHTFCPEGTDFYTGTCFRFLSGVRVLIAVGCCAKCAGGSR